MRSGLGQTSKFAESQDQFMNTTENGESFNDLGHLQESRDFAETMIENSPTFVTLNNSGIILPSLVKDSSRLDHQNNSSNFKGTLTVSTQASNNIHQMTAPSLISKIMTTDGPSETRDLLDFSVMTDLRKPEKKAFGTGKTAAETPSKLFRSGIRLHENQTANRSRLDPQQSRFDSISSTHN